MLTLINKVAITVLPNETCAWEASCDSPAP
jgi:hypothetical protein